ncbi:hypothetical protein [Pseudogracilibacillus sp. ICA-222130]|uniref:hypothetical protein n=1 Tax=Pseudogracilibacillus sp. ICA-222130 TaxID=3134655 RepID=UPI0030BB9A8F
MIESIEALMPSSSIDTSIALLIISICALIDILSPVEYLVDKFEDELDRIEKPFHSFRRWEIYEGHHPLSKNQKLLSSISIMVGLKKLVNRKIVSN